MASEEIEEFFNNARQNKMPQDAFDSYVQYLIAKNLEGINASLEVIRKSMAA